MKNKKYLIKQTVLFTRELYTDRSGCNVKVESELTSFIQRFTASFIKWHIVSGRTRRSFKTNHTKDGRTINLSRYTPMTLHVARVKEYFGIIIRVVMETVLFVENDLTGTLSVRSKNNQRFHFFSFFFSFNLTLRMFTQRQNQILLFL